MRQLYKRGHIDPDHLDLAFERNVREIAGRAESRVVDKQINPPPSPFGRVEYLSWRGSKRQIRFDHCDVNAVPRAQPIRQSVKPVTRTRGNDDVRAIGGKPARECLADPV